MYESTPGSVDAPSLWVSNMPPFLVAEYTLEDYRGIVIHAII